MTHDFPSWMPAHREWVPVKITSCVVETRLMRVVRQGESGTEHVEERDVERFVMSLYPVPAQYRRPGPYMLSVPCFDVVIPYVLPDRQKTRGFLCAAGRDLLLACGLPPGIGPEDLTKAASQMVNHVVLAQVTHTRRHGVLQDKLNEKVLPYHDF